MRDYWVDLHIHTVLSPCGELEMGAPEIVDAVRSAGIDIVAISDHNSCDNFPAVAACAAGNPLVLPAIEVQTAEDIHVLTIFPEYEAAHAFQRWLWERIRPIPNDPDVFGLQVVVDERNEILRMEETLLLQGAGYDIDTVVAKGHEAGAIVVLAHVDRPAFAYPAVLGPLAEDYPADAFELSCRLAPAEAAEWRRRYPDRTFLRSSDSHSLEALRRENCTRMRLEAPAFEEIRLALAGSGGRGVAWPWEQTD